MAELSADIKEGVHSGTV